MKDLFDHVSARCSRLVTHTYSTSFSLGIFCLHPSIHEPIYAIYGFVRLADEIVDSFHGYDKASLLARFKEETFRSVEEKISLNPVLNSFQKTVNQYKIETSLIDQFLHSMETDLTRSVHDTESFKTYILGSAEVVGLMCLKIFSQHDANLYEELKPYAMSLGSAFQKVNFLRDIKEDYVGLGRNYFPGIEIERLNDVNKKQIEESIAQDFKHAYMGIKQLPKQARLGVYVAYVYYLALFNKIKNTNSHAIMRTRIRIRNRHKAQLLAYSYFKHQFNLM
ncbi:MAG TPA: phytoene/squalene synthase family protein [Ohtaekwangia sp.]|nr:phytoene/squalene synthase family protein [Ohtaekwangia sp.]